MLCQAIYLSGFTSVTGSTRFMLECTLCTLCSEYSHHGTQTWSVNQLVEMFAGSSMYDSSSLCDTVKHYLSLRLSSRLPVDPPPSP